MKKIILLLAFFVFSCNCLAQTSEKWQEERSTHFIVSYKKAPPDFVKDVVEYSERYYNQIADNLGFRRFDFWLWEKRAKIYIYDDSRAYQAGTGFPAWSGGFADVKNKTIYTFPYASGFLETVLPHELGHIIFREFVGFDNFLIPVWLDEGVASFQEKNRYISAEFFLRQAITQNAMISLNDLTKITPQTLKDNELVKLYYAEAVSLVHFLISEFGREKFILFCQRLRDRSSLELSLRSTYSFTNLQDFENKWLDFLKK